MGDIVDLALNEFEVALDRQVLVDVGTDLLAHLLGRADDGRDVFGRLARGLFVLI